MGLGFIPDGPQVEQAFKDFIEYSKNQYNDVLDETGETAASAGIGATANTAKSIATTGNWERAYMLENPKWASRRFLRKAGPIGVGISTGIDTYQGRDNAYKIFGPNANIGQRAAAVGSSIANGVTFGAFNFNDPKAIKNVYKYYGG